MFRIPIHNKNYKVLIMAFCMRKGILPMLLFLGLGAIYTIGLATRQEELRNSPQIIETDSPSHIRNMLIKFHGGAEENFKNDYDWDGDGTPDLYLEGKDKTVYSTHSNEPNLIPNLRNSSDPFKFRFYKHKRQK